jgi:hypothetical protein
VRRLTLVVLVAFACGPLTAHAQTLSLAYHSGDTSRYRVHTIFNETLNYGTLATTFSIKFDMTAQETVTVQSVDAGGTADLLIALTGVTAKGSVNGDALPMSGVGYPSIDLKVAADGRIVGATSSGIGPLGNLSALAGMGGTYISAVLPDTAVKPGDTWAKSYDQPNPIGSGVSRITTNSKYLRDETVQGINAAVVETTSKASYDITIDTSMLFAGQTGSQSSATPGVTGLSMTLKGVSTSDATTWVDASGHRPIKTHVTSSTDAAITMPTAGSAATPGMTGPIEMKGTSLLDLTPT